jgi:K+-transporting ATPase c subunit
VLIGQAFSAKNGDPLPQYSQPRPSDAGTEYHAARSGASAVTASASLA